MFARLFLLAVVLVFSTVPTLAIDFSTPPLASYELNEVNDLNVSPDPNFSRTLNCGWPVLGGVNDVPEATAGNYVLKLDWTNEPDHNTEAGHYWNNSTFDLIDVNYLLVDVYFATESALPAPENKNVSIWTKWDSNTHWISCESVPPTTNEWYTVGFNVGDLNYKGLDHINALSFSYMNGTSGAIYVDNLRLLRVPDGNWPHIRRKIKFSGYWWSLMQCDYQIGAGPSCFTDDQNDVWVDANGLHFSIVYKDPNWYCSEVVANKNLGYGKYIYTVDANTDLLDPNIIVGLFAYDVCDPCGYHEIDVELTKWGDSTDTNNAQYVVQLFDPCRPLESRDRFKITYSTTVVTHEFIWNPNVVAFRSYYGDYSPNPPAEAMIRSWSYTGPNVPRPAKDNPRINFYLTKGAPPQNGQNAHITIKNFRYVPIGDLDSDGDVDFQDFALLADKWLWGKE
jgi:hypothetical protein